MRSPLFLLLFACAGGDSPSPPIETDTGSDTGAEPEVELTNLLANPGFELGESWWRPAGYVNHEWATNGDGIFGSSATFTAREGSHAQKIWGLYAGDVPNDSEHGLTLTDITAGDTHTFSVWALTHADDALTGGSEAVAFLRFTDASGAVLAEYTRALVEVGDWTELLITADAPEGAVGGALGLRFSLADWSATGSVYLDEASWTSTGTGTVAGERLLVWNDEFSGSAIDGSKWTHELLPPYTFNNELQQYTDSPNNSRVEDGQLVITGRNDGGGYTSARLNTSGKGDWLYGRMEGMVLVPDGVGTWPALWMLPSELVYGAWPDSGEIDIMEHVGCDLGVMHGSVHTGAYNHMIGTQQTGGLPADAYSFHLYAVDWSEDRLIFSLDGREYFRFENDGTGDYATWPFDQLFHIVVNLAIGGDWGGYCGLDAGAFPEEYRLDWIRVYQ